MESLDAKWRNIRAVVGRSVLGTRTEYDRKTFYGNLTIAGEAGPLFKLPSTYVPPVIDFVTGEFYFMADYDGADAGDKPLQ